MSETTFLEDDQAILAEFVDEAESDLVRAAAQFVELEARPRDFGLINEIFRPIHSIKGNSAFLGLMQVRSLAHEIESLLDDLRKQRSEPSADIITALLAGVDQLKIMMARIRAGEPETPERQLFDKLLNQIRQLQVGGRGRPAPAAPATEQPTTEKSTAPAVERRPALERTLRIPERYIEEWQSFADELEQILLRLKNTPSDPPAQAMSDLATMAAAMQKQLAALRTVTAGDLLQRAPRLARETAAVTGKQVRVILGGENLRLPKALVEILETPLMHLVRNAVDHGIEMPALRRRAGKPEEGCLWVEMREVDAGITLRIADDGDGINFKTLLAKAMTQGLCPRGRAMTPADVLNLIFLPGISAARNVTEISGRGVGMDIVKTSIEEAGGKIQVNSRSGKGTEFLIHLPANPAK